MVWPFKKNKILDFTKSQIKIPESVKARLEGEYKETAPQTNTNASSSADALSFLGSMAASSEPSSDAEENLSLKHLKVKIEDIEYKLDSMARKMSSFIDRVDLTEKKIDRMERRGV